MESSQHKIEIFYTLMCPNCKVLIKMLEEVLPMYGEKFLFKKSLASSPIGMVRTMKMGIHTVPALLINNKLIFRAVPTKEELIKKFNEY